MVLGITPTILSMSLFLWHPNNSMLHFRTFKKMFSAETIQCEFRFCEVRKNGGCITQLGNTKKSQCVPRLHMVVNSTVHRIQRKQIFPRIWPADSDAMDPLLTQHLQFPKWSPTCYASWPAERATWFPHGPQCGVPAPAESALPGKVLNIQVVKFWPKLSDTPELEPSNLIFNKPTKWFWHMLHFHNPILSNAFFKEKTKMCDTDMVYSRRTHVEPHTGVWGAASCRFWQTQYPHFVWRHWHYSSNITCKLLAPYSIL